MIIDKKCPLCGAKLFFDECCDEECFCLNFQSLDSLRKEISCYLNSEYNIDAEELDYFCNKLIKPFESRIRAGIYKCDYEEIICKNDGKAFVVMGDKNTSLPGIIVDCKCNTKLIEVDNEVAKELESFLHQ